MSANLSSGVGVAMVRSARTAVRNTDPRDEIEMLRDRVDCATVLENLGPPWRVDEKGSTRNQRKYRRGDGEIIIVNHRGRGWWDPNSTAKGDVFALVQHLEPGLNFGQVRQRLRKLVGVVLSAIAPKTW